MLKTIDVIVSMIVSSHGLLSSISNSGVSIAVLATASSPQENGVAPTSTSIKGMQKHDAWSI